MTNPIREDLLGYLIGAIEPAERQQVEDALTSDVRLRRDLDLIHRSLEPLAADREPFNPPAGLALRTCGLVADYRIMPAALTPAPAGERATAQQPWTWTDLAVAAGIFVAASLLLFPALGSSHIQAQLAACQNNLRLVGNSLTSYSEANPDRLFPVVPSQGNKASAGIYAPILVDNQFLGEPEALICPGDATYGPEQPRGRFKVPSIAEIEAAQGAELQRLQASMGGSYGYTFGYMEGDRYRPTRNLRRANFAILADAPAADRTRSANHGGCGQNVLFEDGHVEYLTSCRLRGFNDHLFQNVRGQVAPGLHLNDAVIATGPLHLQLGQ